MTTQLLIALGGNLVFQGQSPQAIIKAALGALKADGFGLLNISQYYETPCFPAGAGPDYVNAAGLVTVPDGIAPTAILARLHSVEAAFGRARDKRWGGRTLDIDLLAIGDSVQPDLATYHAWADLPADQQAVRTPEHLILPHPRLHERAFVLGPLMDVAPDWRHPVLGLTVRQMWARQPQADRAAVMAIKSAE